MKYLQYKHYYGSIEASVDDDCLYGKLEFIKALVNYEGRSVKELEQSFRSAVDDYLLDCKAIGREPAQSFKGSFNVRTGSDLHRQAVIWAKEQNISLNEFVKQSIKQALISD
ncbi:MAG: type II toxin-antitoxin system HicB family antitoxin [Gammaproteobacteria bacterium]|nr:type II toxin-antitoxin system HicB family antitoxin [Gammaproteobacteria bacterium]